MKTKLFLTALCSMAIISCKEISNVFKIETNYKPGILLNFDDNEKSIITASINGKQYKLFFDTGSNADLVIDEAKFDIDQKKNLRNRKISGFENKSSSQSIYYAVDSIRTNLFRAKNIPIFITGKRNTRCAESKTYEGIINMVTDSDLPVELNYQKGFVKILDKLPTNINEYTEVEGKFSGVRSTVEVKLNFSGGSDYFLIDTGNNGPTLINSANFKPSERVTSIQYLAAGVGGTTIPFDLDIYNTQFSVAGKNFTQYIAVDKSSHRSVLSFKFIKKFNWIIDRKNKKIYMQPNLENLDAPFKTAKVKNLTDVKDSKLIVSYSVENSKYKISQEITKVDQTQITPENICQYQKLLNETENWDTLNLVVK